MRNPKVCVVMPVYNGAATIQLALKSLIAQSYSNWICVIVNDGSIDNTKEILDSLSDSRFIVYHLPENRGRGNARQFALEHAEGDFLTYLDADDFFHTEKIKTQVDILMKDSQLDLVATEVLIYDDNYKAVGKRVKSNCQRTFFKTGDSLQISMATSMIRLQKAQTFQYNNKLDAGEDIDFFTRYLNGGYYLHIPYPYYYYYVSSSNTSYRKILHYTGEEIKRGLFLMTSKTKLGLRVLMKSCIKWVLYAFLLPILGEDFFLRRRNTAISDSERIEYKEQFDKVTNIDI